MRQAHTWIGVLGIGVGLFGLLLAIVAFGDLLTGQAGGTDPAALVAIVVVFLLLAACGLWMFLDNLWWPRGQATSDLDQRILVLAASKSGRLTVEEAAVGCQLSIPASKAALDHMAAENSAQMEVTHQGTLVYVFPGFLTDEEKRSARPL